MQTASFPLSKWLALGALGLSCAAHAQTTVKVFAAGSLTGALTAIAQQYGAATGDKVETVFGPAGLLRERIEQGEGADVFASANMDNPQQLARAGKATPAVVFARNRLCATALPEFKLTTKNFLNKLLDPKTKLGTSTPKADPGGDYTWQMFARAEKVRPGAQALLEAKAQQLVGGAHNPPIPAGQDAGKYYFSSKKVDIFMGYCSSRKTTPDLEYSKVELPPELAVNADYGMTVINKPGNEAAYRFALYLLSPEAQSTLAAYGFTPVATPKP